ncbi:hypothetical protein XELAEV_18012456mg [Xenopus laevis]|uniref:Uncharacterized protein n=1 Tax=Xenopus laevis TaxID=8355 RepID=A0A974DPH7_XENLA|nr:hypothetical protein XELAEV_18012456mg [Xenopus laevis]
MLRKRASAPRYPGKPALPGGGGAKLWVQGVGAQETDRTTGTVATSLSWDYRGGTRTTRKAETCSEAHLFFQAALFSRFHFYPS